MLLRLFVIVVGVPVLVWTFFAEFGRGVVSSASYAGHEVMMNFRQMRAAFKAKSTNEEDWK
ncbi:hypothetical protein Q5692_40045 [Microcoleus sp. C2C3]|uniref:hypothetical protein n=1 Tax=Microcoleus sp. C2C3 TaxID=3055324 RepID=UPI002FCFBDBD